MVKLEVNGVEVPFKQWKFPAGEVGVQLPQIAVDSKVRVSMLGMPSSDDLMVTLQVLDALKIMKVWPFPIELYIPYFPYARQDRVCNAGESFALKIFMRTLLQFGIFNTLTVVDPHSEVFNDLFYKWNYDNVTLTEIKQWECTKNLPKFDWIIAPDAGALDKAKFTQPNSKHLSLNKVRVGSEVIYESLNPNILSGHICIVDDICDGGKTFIALAQMLNETQREIASISLYVTHGIFSQGTAKLRLYFDEIYCYNLMNENVKNLVKEIQ